MIEKGKKMQRRIMKPGKDVVPLHPKACQEKNSNTQTFVSDLEPTNN